MFIFSSFILLALSDAIMQCKRPARWKLHDSIGAIREESEMTENLAVYELARPATAERFSVADGKPLVRVEPAIFFLKLASNFSSGEVRERDSGTPEITCEGRHRRRRAARRPLL